jgi:hypothetical protein
MKNNTQDWVISTMFVSVSLAVSFLAVSLGVWFLR